MRTRMHMHMHRYEHAVRITEEAHRELPRDTEQQRETADAFDERKMIFYLSLVLSTIAAHCSEEQEEGMPAITVEQLQTASVELLAAREADANCAAETSYRVNFTRVANELRVASGAHAQSEHTGDGLSLIHI